jgi:metallophosphoesterase superfamily enzyme
MRNTFKERSHTRDDRHTARRKARQDNQARIIVVGDLHLDWNPRFLQQGEHDKYTLDVMRHAVARAVFHDAHAIVFTGDVFDTPQPSQDARAVLSTFLNEVAQNHPELTLWFYTGNHDTESATVYSLRWLKPLCGKGRVLHNVRVTNRPQRIKINGANVLILPWFEANEQNNENVKKLLIGGRQLVFAHNEVRGALMDNGWVADGLDLSTTQHAWVIGHLHTAQDLHQGMVTYVGTPTARHMNHKTRRMLLVTLTHDDGTMTAVEKQDIPVPQPYELVEGLPPKRYEPNTYYKVHLELGEPVPNNPQVVATKRIGETSTKDKKKAHIKVPATLLPNPTDWLVSRLAPEKQERGRALLMRAISESKQQSLHDQDA